MSFSDPVTIPLEMVGNRLIVEAWLAGQATFLFRLVLDTGATHIALPQEYITQLGLTRYGTGEMRVPGKRTAVKTSLYVLPRIEVQGIVRENLLVARVTGASHLGAHGLLGMNWLSSFRHLSLIDLDTETPALVIHSSL